MKIDIGKFDKKRIINIIIYTAVIALGIALDQITKLIAVKHLKGAPSVPVIEGVIQWSYVENRGAAWGMFDDKRWVFMSISTVAIIGMAVYLFLLMKENSYLYGISLSLLVSGGIGNMIDRIFLGYVVDFIDFCLIDFPVFNLADSIVCIGAGLLILALVLDIIAEAKKQGKKGQGKE